MDNHDRSTRRDFFLRGGMAALGAGMAATTGAPAAAGTFDPERDLPAGLLTAFEREAIAKVHQRFMSRMSAGRYDEVVGLFAPDAEVQLAGERASGEAAIARLFARYQSQEAAVIHSAYRRNPRHMPDLVTVEANHAVAHAFFYVEAEVSTPIEGDCTAAQMARLQGQYADRRWETGTFDTELVKVAGQWRLAQLKYKPG